MRGMARSVVLAVVMAAAACSPVEPGPVVAEPPVSVAVVPAKVEPAKPAAAVERIGPDTADAI